MDTLRPAGNVTFLQELLCRHPNFTGNVNPTWNISGNVTGNLTGTLHAWNLSCDLLDRRKMASSADLNYWVRILLYSIIFLLSVFGNTLIIIVLLMNKRLRTVTNSFLLSLAVSDLMVAVLCMPFTLIPNLMGNFIFGEVICRTAAYFMGLSVSVSTFNLVAIAIERYSAICNPLKSRVWQTRSHAYKVIAATWILSIIIMIPYTVYNTIVPFPMKEKNRFGYQCRLVWPNNHVQQAWIRILIVDLTYLQVFKILVAYAIAAGHTPQRWKKNQLATTLTHAPEADKNGMATSVCGAVSAVAPCDEGDGCYIQVAKRRNTVEMSALTPSGFTLMIRWNKEIHAVIAGHQVLSDSDSGTQRVNVHDSSCMIYTSLIAPYHLSLRCWSVTRMIKGLRVSKSECKSAESERQMDGQTLRCQRFLQYQAIGAEIWAQYWGACSFRDFTEILRTAMRSAWEEVLSLPPSIQYYRRCFK
ncbi:cholecystokinin receptor-like [Pelobates cultripes]|uniref:Gastrin/cholecystokinin type B receptor n=1 Tax=Pelobates cultripes TaxID=61616 RepID=A0AAD1R8Y7_PELCU|nr:cholecystokinin receptor-like [Pelobates cultripes]